MASTKKRVRVKVRRRMYVRNKVVDVGKTAILNEGEARALGERVEIMGQASKSEASKVREEEEAADAGLEAEEATTEPSEDTAQPRRRRR